MTEKKSSLLRNLTLATIVSGAAIGAHFGFSYATNRDPFNYNRPAVTRPAEERPAYTRSSKAPDEAPQEPEPFDKYYSAALAGLALVVFGTLIAVKVKKPFLAYTLLNDYLARRRQSKQE